MVPQPQLRPASLEEIRPLRAAYLKNLPEVQEAFLEMLVGGGSPQIITLKGQDAGYLVVHQGAWLVEYYLSPEFQVFSQEIFPKIIKKLELEGALVKTFDHLFLAGVLDSQVSVKSKGLIVRDYLKRELPVIERIQYTRRQAQPEDLALIQAVDQDVFTHPERLGRAIAEGAVYLFERDAALIGFCLIRHVLPGSTEVDVGIAVDAPYRNKGYSVYMLQEMVEFCIEQGLRPVTGCELENTASYRMGRRIGFTARYRLLEARFR